MRTVRKFLDALVKIFEYFCIGLFVVMVLITLLQVIARYILKISIPWTEEIARVLYVWIIFIGIMLVEADDINIKTTFFIEKLPKKVFKSILVTGNVLAIILYVIMFFGGLVIIQTSWVYTLASIPSISSTIFYFPIIISTPFILLFLLRQIHKYLVM